MSDHGHRAAPKGPGPAFTYVFVKPVLATLLAGAMVVFGLNAMQTMVREGMPDVDIPTATVITAWPGASAELVEKEITNELERALKSLDRVKKVSSTSMASLSYVLVEFEATAPSGPAIQSVRDEVATVEATLPADADKPTVEQVRVSDIPVVAFVLSGGADDALLAELALELEEGLERLAGVRDAGLSGHREEIVQVLLDPAKVDELRLSTADIAGAIDRANVTGTVGAIEAPQIRADVGVEGRFKTLQDLRDVPISRSRDARTPVTLGRIAEVRRDLEPAEQRASLSVEGEPYQRAVVINLFKQAGSDTVRLVERASAFIAERTKAQDWPPGVTVTKVDDETTTIERELSETLVNTLQSCLIVFLVLLMLLSWREALVAGLAIPVTFLGVLAVLQMQGQTLNQLLLVGLIIALGLLVDVFILVMEGMHDALVSEGLPFPRAVQKTVRLYALPALAGQATTMLALVPLFMVGGAAGKFIQIVPMTVIAALGVSFVIAFVCALPLSRRVLTRGGGHSESWVDRLTARVSASMARALGRTIVRSRWTSLAVVLLCLATLGLAFRAAGLLDFELFPKTDNPRVGFTLELEPDASLADSQALGERVGEFLRAQPEFETVTMYVGRKSPMAPGTLGRTDDARYVGFSGRLRPLEERDVPAYELVERWRPELEAVLAETPGVRLEVHAQTGGVGSGAPVQVLLSGDEPGALRDAVDATRRMLGEVAGVNEVTDDLGPPEPSFAIVPRQDAYDLYGLSPQGVVGQLRYALDHQKVTTFDRAGTLEPLDVRLGTAWPSRQGLLGSPGQLSELSGVSVVDGRGQRRSLSALHDLEVRDAAAVWKHRDGDRTVTVGAWPAGRTATSVVAEVAGPLLAMLAEDHPRVRAAFGGEAEDTADTFADVPGAFAMAIFLVFATLALLFVSFRQPFIILAIIPMALVGTFFGFYAVGFGLSFPAVIGIIALIGIVVNDSIVMVEAMNERLGEGMSLHDAAARGAADRLRPILSTTLTTVGGMVPLALADPTWQPLASAVVFGLMGSTVLAFVLTPALYLLLTPEGHRQEA